MESAKDLTYKEHKVEHHYNIRNVFSLLSSSHLMSYLSFYLLSVSFSFLFVSVIIKCLTNT